MVYGFVQRSGGHLSIYSEPGKCTNFHIFLPRAQVTDSHGDVKRDALLGLPRGSETILIVDDEEDLIYIAAAYLDELGYKTIAAHSSQQALGILEHRQDIDLLFSDIVMPGEMDGYHLALMAKKINPELNILLSSGFTISQQHYIKGESRLLADLASTLLSKPYNKSELAHAVRRRMDG